MDFWKAQELAVDGHIIKRKATGISLVVYTPKGKFHGMRIGSMFLRISDRMLFHYELTNSDMTAADWKVEITKGEVK